MTGGVEFITPWSVISTVSMAANSQSGHIRAKGGTRTVPHSGQRTPRIFISSLSARK